MRLFADLHIHSRFSRACSKDITIKSLERNARLKGINLLGTGDFAHPQWLQELKAELHDDGTGFLRTASGFPFVLQVEISNIFTQGGKGRKVHNLILVPSFAIADQVQEWLAKKGRLDYDGRPIFGFSCIELVEGMMAISKDIVVIPAHIWTPWFSVFGSQSGFDSIEDCFGDQAKHIHALETGLSSDPAMNWRLSALDKYTLVSFSDSHSHQPWRIGRECCRFDLPQPSYQALAQALTTGDRKHFLATVEFFPEEGKYHYDGHRLCNVSMAPAESRKHNDFCPVCKRKMTIGVLHRVEQLADRPEGYVQPGAIPFHSLMPLSEVIAHVEGVANPYSKTVWAKYASLVKEFGNELALLLDANVQHIEKVAGKELAGIIVKMRSRDIKMVPGYDGVYGKLALDGQTTAADIPKPAKQQTSISDY
ncbi:MAG: DNA helicase UvrD [Candidatus Aenigmarchaeota archaeon]|nr:DNA helicase UvrD [Candidatus Aenigmarchaeota archaeon]